MKAEEFGKLIEDLKVHTSWCDGPCHYLWNMLERYRQELEAAEKGEMDNVPIRCIECGDVIPDGVHRMVKLADGPKSMCKACYTKPPSTEARLEAKGEWTLANELKESERIPGPMERLAAVEEWQQGIQAHNKAISQEYHEVCGLTAARIAKLESRQCSAVGCNMVHKGDLEELIQRLAKLETWQGKVTRQMTELEDHWRELSKSHPLPRLVARVHALESRLNIGQQHEGGVPDTQIVGDSLTDGEDNDKAELHKALQDLHDAHKKFPQTALQATAHLQAEELLKRRAAKALQGDGNDD